MREEIIEYHNGSSNLNRMSALTLVIMFTTFASCADTSIEQSSIDPENSWTSNFEKAKGQLRPQRSVT